MKLVRKRLFILALATISFGISAVNANQSKLLKAPSLVPGAAQAYLKADVLTLENRVISAAWSIADKHLRPVSINDISQEQCSVFRIATGKPVSKPIEGELYLGMRLENNAVKVMISADGKSWQNFHTFTIQDRSSVAAKVRLGKMDTKGGNSDYGSAGADGVCSLSDFKVYGEGAVLIHEEFNTALDKDRWQINLSKKPNSAISAMAGKLEIKSGANCANNIELDLPEGWSLVSCKISKGTDAGMSWGPGMALLWDDGHFVSCSMRDNKTLNIITKDGEKITSFSLNPKPDYNLHSETFNVIGKPEIIAIAREQAGIKVKGKAILVNLKDKTSGIKVSWKALLWDDAHYIRQEFAFVSATDDIAVNGLELQHCRIGYAEQIGIVPGSPVASSDIFAGVEMPVASNTADAFGDIRCGFGCNLTLTSKVPICFNTVLGVYAKGQLRRSFLAYIEAERARLSKPFLHYNCWYDLGFNVNAKDIIEVADEFQKNLAKPFGLEIDSYLADDGWDDFGVGLWSINLKKFPGGFEPLQKELEKRNSKLGIWISPLGGYGGANERTQFAKNMGLIKGDKLDLSEPGYFKWFNDKCSSLVKDNGVNYFKWDRAGSGVSPHFMALLNVAHNLRKLKEDVYVNVTVGTWPSPFWLNHVDCTWRDGTGDVAWSGKGDNRQQWITFRDQSCYQATVVKAPLYPLNSLMHHGIVHGRHFQAARVSEAGADLKEEARSYFGAGPTLQELYLTPSMMTAEGWSQVGQAAKWAHANADVLVDSHWIGGDPSKLQPYGYASWSPRKGTITLRNPDDKPQPIAIDIEKVFELPIEAPRKYLIKNAYPDQKADEVVLTAGKDYILELKPFEVLVFDALPVKP
ncbi:MAG: alpha-galactosidase [Phycisphaerae bacterium]|nr:alpha-galactosidase [Phycisphaerae bacterium]